MEYVIGFGLAALIMLCLGFSLADVGMLLVWILAAIIVLTALFFTVCLFFLVASKPVKAEFLRFDDTKRFPAAVYRVDGEERRNVFPCEMMLKKKLYVEEKGAEKQIFRFCYRRKRVRDDNSRRVRINSVRLCNNNVGSRLYRITRYL